jgi:4-hydroxy-3-polyprenylbenzoate decarboxylase
MPAQPQSLFVGVTGASGAPYALRLVEMVAAAGCQVHLCLSDVAVQVLAYELRLAGEGRDDVTREFLEAAGAIDRTIIHSPAAFDASCSSGSSFPDAAVICPCSLSTASEIAIGSTRTLIHRVGAVALKEGRPLVIVPREMPLSSVSLRRLLELSEAGALVVPPMPAFYHRPTSLEDLVDFVTGKLLSVLGFEQDLYTAWTGTTTLPLQ